MLVCVYNSNSNNLHCVPHNSAADANGYCNEPGDCLCKEGFSGDLCTQRMFRCSAAWFAMISFVKHLFQSRLGVRGKPNAHHFCGCRHEPSGSGASGNAAGVATLEQEASEGTDVQMQHKTT